MTRIVFLASVLSIGISGFGDHSPEVVSEGEAAPELTPEAAKAALIDLIRSETTTHLEGFPLERYADDLPERGKGQTAFWGPFQIELGDRTYSYTRRFGQPPRVCTWEYRGEFEMRDGRWVALPP